MASRKQLEKALRNAHAAGDENAARRLAQALQAASVEQPGELPTAADIPTGGQRKAPAQAPSFIDKGLAASQAGAPGGDSLLRSTAKALLAPAWLPTQEKQQLARAAIGGGAQGLTRFAEGAGQRVAGAGEALGILPQGQEAGVKGGAELLRQQISGLPGMQDIGAFQPVQTAARFGAEVAPYMAVQAPAAAGLLGKMGITGLEAGLAGATAPTAETGAEGMREAAGHGAKSAMLGAGVTGGLGLLGKGAGAVTRLGSKRTATLGKTPEEIAESSRLAREEGIFTIPGGKQGEGDIADPLVANIGRMHITDKGRVKVRSLMQRSEAGAKRTVGSLFSDVLPEGSPRQVQGMVDDLFTAAREKNIPIPEEQMAGLLQNQTINKIARKISTNRFAQEEMAKYPPGTFGQVDVFRGMVNDEIGNLAAKKTLGKADRLAAKDAMAAKDMIEQTIRGIDPTIDKALSLSHREHIVRDMAKKFGYGKEFTDEVLEVPPMEIYKKFFASRKQYNELLDQVRAIKEPAIREQAIEKTKLVKDVMDRYATTKSAVDKVIGSDPEEFAKRGIPTTAGLYTSLNLIKNVHNRSVLNYILDKQADPAVARAAMEAKDPTAFATEFARLLSIGSARMGQGDETESQR